MAIFKPGEDITGISGKVGGTSFSKQSQYNTIRNSPRSNKSPKTEQSTRRFLNGAISQQWRELSPAQRDSYEAEAPFYTYKNAFGVDVPRAGYGLYLYLAQNLVNFDIKAPGTAPAFSTVTAPIISIDSATPTELIISGTDLNSDYRYNIWAKPNNKPGQAPSKKYIELCGAVTAAQLTAGVDVLPLINNKFKFEFQYPWTFLGVEAVNLVTGNKVSDFDLVLINQTLVLPNLFVAASFLPPFQPINAGDFSPDGLTYIQPFWGGARGTRQFTLSNPFLPGTLGSGTLFSGTIGWYKGNYFINNGTQLIACANGETQLRVWNLVSSYNIIGATVNSTHSIAGKSCRVSPDGMVFIMLQGNNLRQYNLSTAFDFSTAVLTYTYPLGYATFSHAVSPDGTKIIVLRSSNRLYSYALETAWNLSTISLLVSNLVLDSITASTNFGGIGISPNGKYWAYAKYNNRLTSDVLEFSVPWTLPNAL